MTFDDIVVKILCSLGVMLLGCFFILMCIWSIADTYSLIKHSELYEDLKVRKEKDVK